MNDELMVRGLYYVLSKGGIAIASTHCLRVVVDASATSYRDYKILSATGVGFDEIRDALEDADAVFAPTVERATAHNATSSDRVMGVVVMIFILGSGKTLSLVHINTMNANIFQNPLSSE